VEKRTGPLGVGFGVRNELPEGYIGPEYGFDRIVGNALNDPILLIKTAWGGKSLAVDFRPPSSVMSNGGVIGPYYTEMITSVRKALNDIARFRLPDTVQGYELVGFG
jgi:alpha-galactosidase